MAEIKRAVLLFGEAPQAKAAAEQAGLPVIQVPPEAYRQPLAVLVGKRKPLPPGETQPEAPLPETLAVYHGYTGAFLSRALDALRGAVSLRAITTPMNLNWTVYTLYRHLAEERERLRK